jgi:hypothetical protein
MSTLTIDIHRVRTYRSDAASAGLLLPAGPDACAIATH